MADIAGVLIGLLRRLTGGGSGMPRFSESGQRVREQSHLLRNMPEQLQQLIDEHPARPEALAMRAEVELEEGRLDAALATAARLRERFPRQMTGYHYGCTVLRRLKRFPEAEAMARAAIRRFPRSSGAFEALAFCAQEQGDWPNAAARWGVAARRFPGSLWAQGMHAMALARLGHHDAAEASIARTVRKWPEEWWPSFFAAEIAELAGDWQEAGLRWLALRKRFPGRSDAYVRGTRALRQAGALAEAGALIASGIFIFPRDPPMLAERAAVLAAGGDPGPAPEG